MHPTQHAHTEAGQTRFPRMHVSLYSSNIEKTVAFYRSFFDQEPSKVKPGYAKFELTEPALIISFVEKPDRIQNTFGHLGFQVNSAEELEKRMKAARSKGLGMLEEKGTACCYAVQDKFWVTDPDGHQWEVYHFHEDVAFNDPHYAIGKSAEEKATATSAPHAAASNAGVMASPEPAKAESCCAPGSGCC